MYDTFTILDARAGLRVSTMSTGRGCGLAFVPHADAPAREIRR
jgi:hypothetical protein